MELAKYIDHTLLKPFSTGEQVKTLCREAIEYGFASVCVYPPYVAICKNILSEQNIAVCTVVGFPFGANMTSVKAFETELAINEGADEIDVVMNIGAFKEKNFEYVINDIKKVKNICGKHILKVIIETAYLDDGEKVGACSICRDAGADFVKTSTGFAPSGATVADVKLLKKTAGDSLKIKAAGGIKTRAFAEELIAAGADRLGTSSSITIVKS